MTSMRTRVRIWASKTGSYLVIAFHIQTSCLKSPLLTLLAYWPPPTFCYEFVFLPPLLSAFCFKLCKRLWAMAWRELPACCWTFCFCIGPRLFFTLLFMMRPLPPCADVLMILPALPLFPPLFLFGMLTFFYLKIPAPRFFILAGCRACYCCATFLF